MRLTSPFLGTQYYRPPFPRQDHWRTDMARMREIGLDVVQLWVVWGWVEPSPGTWRFEDYDELMDTARDAGLGVVLSTIAEVQPFWIHREEPDATMVDHRGAEVVSELRRECNVGLTPGGCWDHGGLRDRIGTFLSTVTARYAGHPAMTAWDLWNETRWAVQAGNYVCYCQSTLSAFRAWLLERYGDLGGLNAAWKRRYDRIEDVRPGKLPGRPYTDLMEYQAFLQWRAKQHLAWRVGIVRPLDTEHLLAAHSAFPPTLNGSLRDEQALARGNDYELGEEVDAFGCSQFPSWRGMTPAWRSGSDVELATRFEGAYWATAGRCDAWVSELQGGGISTGFDVAVAVDGDRQARWVWSALSRGMRGAIFWAWRDEVFGHESSGFGVDGRDGRADSRAVSLRRVADVFRAHRDLLGSYRPDAPEVGVLFSALGYQLAWAQEGHSERAQASVVGWMATLERLQLPYRVLDTGYLEDLDELKLLVMPWPLSLPAAAEERVTAWVRAGGYLVTEAELAGFDPLGFYRDPAERDLPAALGLMSRGRRTLETVAGFDLGEGIGTLPVATFGEAYEKTDGGVVVARSDDGEPTAIRLEAGAGQLLALGTFPGQPAGPTRSESLERLLTAAAAAGGVRPPFVVTPSDGEDLLWRAGRSADGTTVLYLLAKEEGTEITVSETGRRLPAGATVRDLVGGRKWPVRPDGTGTVTAGRAGPGGVAVLAWR